jgi:peptidoglycan/xylan/chitin deacetylase (PgdA/CDA1 family)
VTTLSSFGRGAGVTAEYRLAAFGKRVARVAMTACSMVFVSPQLALPARAGVERPPQFIVMAFDNCGELERWQELSDFAAEMNRDGDRVHFTFFVSAINFIADQNRAVYEGPRHRRGTSPINFGGSKDDVKQRIAFINALHRSGHEIASHAVGHFNGASWSAADWGKEFRAYGDLVDNVARNNGLDEQDSLIFRRSALMGFRAPYLATSSGLYPALKAEGFRYDTSRISPADAWPEKVDRIWRFNLVPLRIHGSGRNVLSMDYNFFVAHSRAHDDPRRAELYREQMLQTYLDYFKANYMGSRAPLHIGHHFADFQAGAYREALKSFARAVCGLPEVRCVTYAKLADYMDSLTPDMLAAYRDGGFPRAGDPVLSIAALKR